MRAMGLFGIVIHLVINDSRERTGWRNRVLCYWNDGSLETHDVAGVGDLDRLVVEVFPSQRGGDLGGRLLPTDVLIQRIFFGDGPHLVQAKRRATFLLQ